MTGRDDTVAGDPPLRALRRKLAPALVANVAKGKTALAPQVLHEDVGFYRDPARFTAERQALFRSLPLVACLSADLPGPGSFRTFDDAGVPMLLTQRLPPPRRPDRARTPRQGRPLHLPLPQLDL
jgi:hypothetical protein